MSKPKKATFRKGALKGALDLRERRSHDPNMLIFKLLRADEWEALQTQGATDGAPIDVADGYIHFSTAEQVQETAAKYFKGVDGVMLVAYEAEALSPLKWEPSRGGALFPHLYGPLRLDQASWAVPLPLFKGAHAFPEPIDGHVDPTRVQFDAFKSGDRDHPIEMLNLVRLRETAIYPDGREATGAEAYAAYGRETQPILTRLGGSILWRGQFQATLIGPAAERWDHCFIARYPSTHAFLEMVTDPAYRQAVVHRQAAVLTSRLIRCAPETAGESFG